MGIVCQLVIDRGVVVNVLQIIIDMLQAMADMFMQLSYCPCLVHARGVCFVVHHSVHARVRHQHQLQPHQLAMYSRLRRIVTPVLGGHKKREI